MASATTKRPSAPQPTSSFPRFESGSPTKTKGRASTLQNGRTPLNLTSNLNDRPMNDQNESKMDDLFEKSSLIHGEEGAVKNIEEVQSPNDVPDGFDELPIELVSLIDRFIDSLGAKVYNTPPTAEKLAFIFQDFYSTAASHVATHISALSTQQSRGSSPSASLSSKSSQVRPPPRSSSRDTLASINPIPEQQMLTPREISDRRKARRLLDKKAIALEEAVERRVCERVYHRIWRHRSSLDEVRDEKLRSRTAALALVGIGLQDLGVDMVLNKADLNQSIEIEDWIAKARDGLLRMNDSKHPLGKLQQLALSHKCIVDLLTTLHQSSSSADEILPTLIYTLITTPPEGINVISNLNFIQRFRASNKVDGEAAYCLTNLEAAITFLETVDLASLRSDEMLEGPSPKNSDRASASNAQKTEEARDREAPASGLISPLSGKAADPMPTQVYSTEQNASDDHPFQQSGVRPPPSEQTHSHRRSVSNLFQPPALALGAAGDAVRNTADQSIKGIGSALDNSFNLLFGRLSDQKMSSPNPDAAGAIILPKTLDDARRLVEPKPTEEDSPSEVNSMHERSESERGNNPKSDEGLLNAIAGRKQALRDRSVDSNQSLKSSQAEPASAGSAAVESMRNLGNSLNPLKGFGGMNVMQRFGRTPSGTATSAVTDRSMPDSQRSSSPSKTATMGIKTLPPIKRFMDAPDADNLKMSDIPELLQDYKRLAEGLRTFGAW